MPSRASGVMEGAVPATDTLAVSETGQDKRSEREFYDGLFRRRRRFDQFQNDIYRHIARTAREGAPGDQALDLGCGAGTQAVCLADEGFTVVAADLSIEGVKVARNTLREAGRPATLLNADAEHIPLRDGVVDACVCGLLLHHFRDLRSVAVELRRIVRPGRMPSARGSTLPPRSARGRETWKSAMSARTRNCPGRPTARNGTRETGSPPPASR